MSYVDRLLSSKEIMDKMVDAMDRHLPQDGRSIWEIMDGNPVTLTWEEFRALSLYAMAGLETAVTKVHVMKMIASSLGLPGAKEPTCGEQDSNKQDTAPMVTPSQSKRCLH